MTDATVRAAYADRAAEYATLLGSMDAVDDEDRRLLAGWAASLDGPILDVGCGPGHWTAFLAEQGADVEGVDLTPAFIQIARARYPSVRFRAAFVDDLGAPDASLAGVLAWAPGAGSSAPRRRRGGRATGSTR